MKNNNEANDKKKDGIEETSLDEIKENAVAGDSHCG